MVSGAPIDQRRPAPLVIVNRVASQLRKSRRWARIEAYLGKRLGPIEVCFTDRPGHAARRAAQVKAGQYSCVIAAGGDGTVNEVVNGLMSQVGGRPAMGLLPLGLGNDLARSLAIPRNYRAAIDLLSSGYRKRLDVGAAEFSSGQGEAGTQRYFMNVASFGISGQIVADLSKGKGASRYAYLSAFLRVAPSYVSHRVQIHLGDEPATCGQIFSGVLANGRYFGGGMMIAPSALLDDGLLDFVCIEPFSRSRIVPGLVRLFRGTIEKQPGVSMRRIDCAGFVCADSQQIVSVELDGEPAGRLPARFTVLPSALEVICGLVPADS